MPRKPDPDVTPETPRGIPVPDLSDAPPDGGFQPPPPPPPPQDAPRASKRARQRKREEPQQPEAPPPTPEETELAKRALREALGFSFGATFDMIAAIRKARHWKLDPESLALLSDAWVVALLPYMSRFAQFMPLFAALGVTASVIYPRVQLDAAQVKPQDADGKLADAEPITATAQTVAQSGGGK